MDKPKSLTIGVDWQMLNLPISTAQKATCFKRELLASLIMSYKISHQKDHKPNIADIAEAFFTATCPEAHPDLPYIVDDWKKPITVKIGWHIPEKDLPIASEIKNVLPQWMKQIIGESHIYNEDFIDDNKYYLEITLKEVYHG